jgi:hypothetical protein
MRNLLKETIEVIEAYGKKPSDVLWVSSIDDNKDEFWFSWDEFSEIADFDYYNSYGGLEIKVNLQVVGDNWWTERREYDGSEWWEFKTLPKIPKINKIPTKDDLIYKY